MKTITMKSLIMIALTTLLVACGGQKEVANNGASSAPQPPQVIKWKMVTTWPKNYPGLGTGANYMAKIINEMSGGRLQIKVYGANELVGALEVFDAVSRGTAEIGHGAPYYWKGKSTAAQFFTAVPFG
ncbi:MAG: ABC transporter substrate-binding protein, partial [Pseudomonadales bacterium]|nr:ABC transporter substrate-binding protein [Pseudomonadales bacterium]